MKIVVSVVVNEEDDFIEYCLRGIYDFADKIIVIYGEIGYSDHITQEIIETFPDPENKLIIYHYELGQKFIGLSLPGFSEKRYLSLELAIEEGFDWYMIVDADEFYTLKDLKNIRDILKHDKDTNVFFMEYFCFCYNFFTGYWDSVDKNYPSCERIWRYEDGLNIYENHAEQIRDANGLFFRKKVSDKMTINDYDVMMYHMTWVRNSDKMRRKTINLLGEVDGSLYYDEILAKARPDDLDYIYEKNKRLRDVYGIHWCFKNTVLSPFGDREMPEVLSGHPRNNIIWEI